MELQWTDLDPETDERRWIEARRFAKRWSFYVRHRRREPWSRLKPVTRTVWEDLLEGLERRYQRREGVEEADLIAIRKFLDRWTSDEPPFDEDISSP